MTTMATPAPPSPNPRARKQPKTTNPNLKLSKGEATLAAAKIAPPFLGDLAPGGQLPMDRSYDCLPTPPGAKALASPVALANALSAYTKVEGVEGLTFDPMAMERAGARNICLADASGLKLQDGRLKDGSYLVEYVGRGPTGQLRVHWLGHAASSAEGPGFLKNNPRKKAICAAMDARERDATAAPDPAPASREKNVLLGAVLRHHEERAAMQRDAVGQVRHEITRYVETIGMRPSVFL